MRRILRPLGLAVALLTVVPALAADTDGTDKGKLDKILEEIRSSKKEMEDLRKNVELMGQAMARDVRDMQRRLDTLEQNVERLSASPPGRTRSSSYFNPANPAPEVSLATIRLLNRSATAATVVVNGQPIPMAPNSSRNLGVPAGNFTYEVQADGFGIIQPLVSRAVAANELFTISVNPPAAPVILLP